MRLVIIEGKKPGTTVELAALKSVAVGRLASCELAIDEPQASRRHFEVERRSGAVWVKDLGSKNGTYLNETRLEGEAKLQDGDRLRVGATVVAYEASTPLAGGTKLGPYELRAVLERREGLTVHEAYHVQLARTVHLEVLDAGDATAQAFLARARAASSYDHPALLAIFDAGDHDGRAYRVREAVPESRDLEARLREGMLAPSYVLAVGQQVAKGLAHVHARGGVHGWLTPRVIHVDAQGTVKLEVVGGDKLLRLDPARRDARLQALSISPEEARGLDPTAKSDVYALGCVLYRALTGVPPFDGELAQIVRGHASEGAPLPLAERLPDLAGEVDELLRRMLAKKSDQRPKAEEVAEELGRLAPRAPSDVVEPPPPKPKAKGAWGRSGTLKAKRDDDLTSTEDEPPMPAAPPPKKGSARTERPAAKSAARPAPAPPSPAPVAPVPAKAVVEKAPASPAPDESTDETDETPREILTWRRFDPLRAALLGVVYFLLFVISSEGTRIALRILRKE